MKNITLSIPDDLLLKSKEYAASNGSTLNEMVRELLKSAVVAGNEKFKTKIDGLMEEMKVDTTSFQFKRSDLYDR